MGFPTNPIAAMAQGNMLQVIVFALLMQFAPYGVFCLLFTLFAQQGIGKVGDLLVYMLTVIGALLIHGFVVYPLILKGLSGLSPWMFLQKKNPDHKKIKHQTQHKIV